MQVAIDSAKRQFAINLTDEIRRIKNGMDIKNNKYPVFWGVIKHGFNKDNINQSLSCPMNYVCGLNIASVRDTKPKPMSEYFIKHKLDVNRKTCKRVESLIQNYSIKLYDTMSISEEVDDSRFLLRSDFDVLISELRSISISGNYLGLMSWLLDRGFEITTKVKTNSNRLNSTMKKNKPLLIKILYETNQKSFLRCFKGVEL